VRSIGQQARTSCAIEVLAGKNGSGASRLANGRLAISRASYDSTPLSLSKTTQALAQSLEDLSSMACWTR